MNCCASEGAIQRLIDGELRGTKLREVVSHLSGCDSSCAKAAHVSRHESDLISSLFAPDGFAPVPTERRWAAIVTALGGARPAAEV